MVNNYNMNITYINAAEAVSNALKGRIRDAEPCFQSIMSKVKHVSNQGQRDMDWITSEMVSLETLILLEDLGFNAWQTVVGKNTYKLIVQW